MPESHNLDEVVSIDEDLPYSITAQVGAPEKAEKVDIKPTEIEKSDTSDQELIASSTDPDWSQEEIEIAKANRWDETNPKGLSPGEFNRRSPLYDRLHKQNAKLEKTLDELRIVTESMHRKQLEAEKRGYEKALQELNLKRDQAIDEGDRQAVYAFDQEAEKLKTAYNDANAFSQPYNNLRDPETEQYIEENKAWLEDPDMYSVAYGFEQRLFAQRAAAGLPPLTTKEQGKLIRDHVMKTFPGRFAAQGKKAPAAVEASTGSTLVKKAGDSITLEDLSPRQREVYHRIKAGPDPTITPQRYMEMLMPGYTPDHDRRL